MFSELHVHNVPDQLKRQVAMSFQNLEDSETSPPSALMFLLHIGESLLTDADVIQFSAMISPEAHAARLELRIAL